MAQQESGWVLEQHPDPETFRRVWARVMPDGEGSPIALEPEPSERTEQQESLPEERSGPEREPGASLEMLIDRTRAAFESAQNLVRRAGRYGQSIGAVAAEDRTALRRLSAAYYLETGRDYRSNRTPQSPEPLALAPALRRQYQREEELEGLCVNQMKRSAGTQAELLEELSLQFRRHCRTLRQTLERMEPDRLG
ncbi:hypothetical protein L0P50_00250 [Lawsonibacter sp. DFI.6.74]|nr:hypothetical protein [Lawsonibacter sp. DFI.6.74]MCG4771733.1 hypothetical protein [Lawsonibacter sp. DFI.5.51]